jgi:hypothetical protein
MIVFIETTFAGEKFNQVIELPDERSFSTRPIVEMVYEIIRRAESELLRNIISLGTREYAKRFDNKD